MSNLKIAICISGYIRTWEHTRKWFEYIFCHGIQPDIFIHTHHQNYFESDHPDRHIDVYYTADEISKMFIGLNVKRLVIEDRSDVLPELIEYGKKYEQIPGYQRLMKESSDPDSKEIAYGVRILDHLRKIEACSELCQDYANKNEITYDIMVKTRFDVIYSLPHWPTVINHPTEVHTAIHATGGYPDDTVAAGTFQLMIQGYSNRYSQLDNLFYHNTDKATEFCAHNTLAKNLKQYNIHIGNPFVHAFAMRNHDSVHVAFKGLTKLEDVIRNFDLPIHLLLN